jgi:DNA topoisomerase-1
MGHVIELEDRNMEELVAKKFVPSYQVAEGKQKVVKELKSLAKGAGQVWIATDEDREGEAIGRHLTRLLGLDEATTPRIVFHEITKQAISHAIENPRTIDMNLVHAQQGRSVLDKLVGFTLSPLLWKKIKT